VSGTIKIPHVARGRVLHDAEVEYTTRVGDSFMTPRLDLDELVWPRTEPGPAFDVPIAEILDFLGETATHLDLDTNPYLGEAIDEMASVSPHSRRLVENQYRALSAMFEPEALGYQVERELGAGVIDSWTPVHRPGLARCSVRAFPPRLVHVMAGNGAAAAAMSIIRGALTKGVNLLKLPSNDLCTATAILRTMADVDPDHPTVNPVPYVGVQYVDIPQFESLGVQVGQQIAGAIAGTESVSQALSTSQSDASQYTPAELSAG